MENNSYLTTFVKNIIPEVTTRIERVANNNKRIKMNEKKKHIYIASSYTIGDQFLNVQKQISCANKLIDKGYIPFSPLLMSVYLHAQIERDWQTWMDIDYSWIERCDGLLRLKGKSKGADAEVEHAKKLGIPVFYNLEDIRFEA